MKKLRLALLAFALLLAGTSTAFARDSFSFGLNIGGPAYYGPPPAVYYAPPPPVVYYGPAPYYRHYAPRAYYRPYYAPRAYYNHGPYRGWDGHGRGHR
jgi:hypothetical protein